MSDTSLRVALQAFVDDRLSHFGPYDQCVSIDDLEILIEEHAPKAVLFKCAGCGYPDDSIYNADSIYWRCSVCGGDECEENT